MEPKGGGPFVEASVAATIFRVPASVEVSLYDTSRIGGAKDLSNVGSDVLLDVR